MATQVLFPYEVLSTDPALQLSSATVDGEPAPILPREHHVDLYEMDRNWHVARAQARVEVSAEELERVGATEPKVVLTLACGPTNLRATVPTRAHRRIPIWTGEVEMPRVMLHTRGELYATVTATVDGTPDRWLGRSRSWMVDLVVPKIPEIAGGQIPVKWRDFTTAEQGEDPIDPTLHSEVSYMDLEAADGPIIYLNDRVLGLRRLLDERTGRSRLERSVREVSLDLIAQPAIIAMGNAALVAARGLEEDGEPRWPTESWQRGVLETILPLMYPDREPEAALRTAVRALEEVDDAVDVQQRLQAAAGRSIRSTKHTLGVMKALELQDEEEDR